MTDVVGSTSKWQDHPQAMSAALLRHNELFDRIVGEHQGRIWKQKGEGDSMVVEFGSPLEAARCAVEIQRAFQSEAWPKPLTLSVRMSLHYGEVEDWGYDLFGTTLNRCARIRGLAHGGQILLSEAMEQRLRDATGFSLESLGTVRLKDLSQPEKIHQVVAEGLQTEFPPLKSIEAGLLALPVQTTPFVGRAKELQELRELIPQHRLVTLVAFGGAGKSRLALQVVADLSDQYDGVKYIDILTLGPSGLIPELASQFGITQANIADLTEIKRVLDGGNWIVLIDNLDAPTQEFKSDLEKLLRLSKNVHFVVASRDVLRMEECIYRVPTLACPRDRDVTLEQVRQSDAVQLFVSRAKMVNPSFLPEESDAPHLARIVRRLDGLALGIELAAARTKVLSLPQLATKLDADLKILESRLQQGEGRSLVASIEWSLSQLTEMELALARRMAIFAGGATLEAVEQVGAGPEYESWETIDVLESLVDRSLVHFQTWPDPRYFMLSAVRDVLLRSNENAALQATRDAHREFFTQRAQDLQKEFDQGKADQYQRLAEPEIANFRLAMTTAEERGDRQSMLTLCSCLFRFWETRGQSVEGRGWCDRALAVAGESDPKVEASVHNVAGVLASRQGDFTAGKHHHERALEMRRELGDQKGVAGSLNNLANIANDQGHLTEAEGLYAQALEINHAMGNKLFEAINLVNLGTLCHRLARYHESIDYNARSLALFEELGMDGFKAFPLAGIANARRATGEIARAEEEYRHMLSMAFAANDYPWLMVGIEGMAMLETQRENYARASLLFEVASFTRQEMSLPINPSDLAESQQFLDAIGQHLPADQVNKIKAEARQTPWQTVVEELLSAPGTPR